MEDKIIIIFKDLISGFMDLDKINYIADILKNNKSISEKLVFVLDNNSTNEANQALMQMYNSLLGFDVFVGAYANNSFLEYKHLNQLELRKKISTEKYNLNDFLIKKYNKYNIKTHIIKDNIYINLLSIIKENL